MGLAPDVTPAEARLRRLIAADGAVTVDRFMAEALGAYYGGGDPLGAKGDFVTAPEISQMFGELIGLWAVAAWQQMGAPARFRLVELGPGRGTLMADALRAARQAPGFLDAADLHLVDVNASLRATQGDRLADYAPAWHAAFGDVPRGPLLLIANEFLDALPVHQFVRRDDGWRERAVTVDPATDRLAWTDLPTDADLGAAATGEIYEVSPMRMALVTAVAGRCAEDGGAALFIDYGHDGALVVGDSLQAVRGHGYHDPLDSPGAADLTAHVAFGALREAAAAAGARPWGPIGQGAFLGHLGIAERAERLKAGAAPAQATAVDAACRRLIHHDEMGTLFRVLAVTAASAAAPAGFEE
jgi:NADH dehydrogenase [ubiquinone] 1 alpha subcomplex assembly factor 7